MQSPQNIKPIRRSILMTILGFVFIFISLSILYIANTFSGESRQQTEQSVRQWSAFIAEYTINDIQTQNTDELVNKLAAFNANPAILAIDIYNNDENTDSFDLLASYDVLKSTDPLLLDINNKSRKAKIRKNEKDLYLSTVFEDDIIKLLTPIYHQNLIIGYVYIESDPHEGLDFTNHLIIIAVALYFILIIAVFIISMRLENTITAPLRQISTDILHIAKSKDYSYRLNIQSYKEADVMAKNINNFLNRTERHVTQLGLAEQQSLKLNIELEDKVTSRTQALKESNQELLSTLEQLHQFQDQLVESEKMASLGDMVAGVAHEVNTPIGLGVTASTLLSDRLGEIKHAFENKSLKSSQLKRFLSEGDENVGIIYRNLKRAAELISSFKKVAVDQSSEEFRKFNFSELFNEILLTLAPQIKGLPYQINFECPEDLTVVSKPGPVNQVLINLILNSITHGFDGKDNGTINIQVTQNKEQLTIVYKDDGLGISANIKDKVFDPFTTTKRGEGGSGLGLHLVYNLVTQALGGNIQLESETNQGTTFHINFPISEQLL